MSGIGDQTPDTTKGLEVISDRLNIGADLPLLKLASVNICEPLLAFET
ncbi:MAG: hypothetical protein QM484_03440 [Woeseiaceae bacterium]